MFLNDAQKIEMMKEVAIKRWTFISNLISNQILSTTNPAWSVYDHHKQVSPTSYVAYISSKSKITRVTFKPTTGAQWIENVLIRKEESGKYITNDLNRAIILRPVVYEEDEATISIIHDSNTSFSGTNDFILEFIHHPAQIEVALPVEINIVLHERIVNTAVDLAKKVFNPQESGLSQQTDKLMKNPEL